MSQQTTVTKCSHSEQRISDGSKVPNNIVLNNCLDVHIGPKYVQNNNITINRVAAVDDKHSITDEAPDGKNHLRYFIHKCLKFHDGVNLRALLFGSFFLLTTLMVVVAVTLLLKREKPPTPQLSGNSEDYPLEKRFVTRDMWGAAPPCEELPNNTFPIKMVVFIHTVSSGTCNNFNACKNNVLGIQDFHRNDCPDDPDALGDIGYNFILGSDGHIFVGRGWDPIGAHTYGSNNGSIGVAFIGDYRRDEPSSTMLTAARTLLEVGVRRGKLSEDYQLFGHCQRHSGFPYSPGVNIMTKIASWPHWNNTNTKNCANFKPNR